MNTLVPNAAASLRRACWGLVVITVLAWPLFAVVGYARSGLAGILAALLAGGVCCVGALAGLLMVVYVFSLIFSLHTHKELFRGAPQEEAAGEKGHAAWSLPVALVVLGVATFFIAWLSEILVGSVEQAALHLGMSKVFVGIIIVAVIGNAAEHSTAVMAAMKNRMDLSVGIAIGSSTQVALFLTPLLVFLSYFIAPQQMDLVFSRGEVFAIVISASLVAHTTSDGKSNWFTGLLLLTVYLVLAVAFFHVPG